MDTKNVEDFYPLSPMQQGMLYHSRLAPGSGMYIEQFACTLRGKLDLGAFKETWEMMIARHSVLRTGFISEGLKEPIQVVYRQVLLPFEQIDWRKGTGNQQASQLKDFLDTKRKEEFDLTTPPLVRLYLIQIEDNAYYFILIHHHILLDGWSGPLLLREAFANYEASRRGIHPVVGKPRPFRDYIAWLRRQNLDEAEGFWRNTLRGFQSPTLLPFEKRRTISLEEAPVLDEYATDLPEEVSAALERYSRQNQLTMNTILQGAWALLLSHYSGERDIVFGSVVSGRPAELKGVEQMVGMFINTLPVRVDINPQQFLLTWLRELQDHLATLRQYEYTPLMQIQNWSELPRGTPLFATILAYENFPAKAAILEDVESLVIEDVLTTSSTNYPMTIVLAPNPGMTIKVLFDRNLFETAYIEHMVENLQTILGNIVFRPDQCLSQIKLLDDNQQKQLLSGKSQLPAKFSFDHCAHELFEMQAKRTPDSIAVDFEGKTLTYQELNRRANQLARFLQKSGVEIETFVGICVERSLEMIIAVLGILKAGGAFLPLDPTYPADRLEYMLRDSQAPILLTQAKLVQKLPAISARVIRLDTDWDGIALQNDKNLENRAMADNLAYVIYTSGSTGRPKGVMVHHRGLCHLSAVQSESFQISVDSRVLQFSGFSFDASVWEIFMALANGATLCLAQQEILPSGFDLVEFIKNKGITHITLPPSVLRALPVEELPSLQVVIAAGEACTPELPSRWGRGRRFYNAYGPTETTVCATIHLCLEDEMASPPIGQAIGNTRTYLLDQYLHLAPLDIPGELYIGGVSVARGYLNRPDLTAERFIPDPFSNEPGARMYKTGDLVRLRSDFLIEFLGRFDNQVKVRGYRIELEEIETVLLQHPAVSTAAVLAGEDIHLHKYLTAFVVLNQGEVGQEVDFRLHLHDKLPEYMIPATFIELPELPFTPSGKINRKALLDINWENPAENEIYFPPNTPDEHILAEVWAKLFGLAQVSVKTNFFDIGGDSILAMQLVDRARQAGLSITVRQLFQNPTITGLAKVIRTGDAIQIDQGLVTGQAPLLPIQKWFFEEFGKKPNHFNTSMMLQVWNGLDRRILEKTLQVLLEHHDALRLRFRKTEAGWVQIIPGIDSPPSVTLIDLSQESPERHSELIEKKAAELQASLDVHNGPLFCVAIFHLGSNFPDRLLLIFHHLVMDGVSWRILVEDFGRIYVQLMTNEPVKLPYKTISYLEWAVQLDAYAQTDLVREQGKYWFELAGKKICKLPLDNPSGTNLYQSALEITLSMSDEETTNLLKLAPEKYHAQTKELLIYGLVKCLWRWIGETNFLIETEGHGREEFLPGIDPSRTIGWFTSFYPILLELGDTEDVEDGVESIVSQLRNVQDNGFAYGLLRYSCKDQVARDQMVRIPQPEINFNYLGQFDQVQVGELPVMLASESAGPEQDPTVERPCLLYVVCIISGGRLHMRWLYSQKHDRGTIEKLAKIYLEELRLLSGN